MISRRTFLRATATATIGSQLVGTAAASHYDEQPSHVQLDYDKQTLKQYRPYLNLSNLKVRPQALYSWRARSPEYDTDVYVYWAEYTHQEGVTEHDSHYGDHEPCYVFVDSDTGDVQKVIASVYHWMRGVGHASALSLYENTHPRLTVISPWHHYTTASDNSPGEFVDLADLSKAYDSWLDNGLEDDLHPGTVVNPWLMESRGHWWRDNVGDYSTDAIYVDVLRRLGVGKAGQLG